MNGEQKFWVGKIAALDTVALRQAILRPGRPKEASHYPGDEAKSTFHFGASDSERLLGVASMYLEAESRYREFGAQDQYRLRGMAVAVNQQGQGVGRAVLRACLAEAAANGGEIVWCNARESATGFYLKEGFEKLRNISFEIEGIGPHYVMYKRLT